PFGFETITLNRRVKAGETLFATQEVNGQPSPPSINPVVVQPLDQNRVRTTKPDVVEPIYQCGGVVPVANLVPSTELRVTENGTQVGQAAVAGTYHDVVTVPLQSGSKVSAIMVACSGTDHEVKSPVADDVTPLPAPVPPPAPTIDAASLIPGNDVAVLSGLLVGAAVQIFEAGTVISTGWLAT